MKYNHHQLLLQQQRSTRIGRIVLLLPVLLVVLLASSTSLISPKFAHAAYVGTTTKPTLSSSSRHIVHVEDRGIKSQKKTTRTSRRQNQIGMRMSNSDGIHGDSPSSSSSSSSSSGQQQQGDMLQFLSKISSTIDDDDNTKRPTSYTDVFHAITQATTAIRGTEVLVRNKNPYSNPSNYPSYTSSYSPYSTNAASTTSSSPPGRTTLTIQGSCIGNARGTISLTQVYKKLDKTSINAKSFLMFISDPTKPVDELQATPRPRKRQPLQKGMPVPKTMAIYASPNDFMAYITSTPQTTKTRIIPKLTSSSIPETTYNPFNNQSPPPPTTTTSLPPSNRATLPVIVNLDNTIHDQNGNNNDDDNDGDNNSNLNIVSLDVATTSNQEVMMATMMPKLTEYRNKIAQSKQREEEKLNSIPIISLKDAVSSLQASSTSSPQWSSSSATTSVSSLYSPPSTSSQPSSSSPWDTFNSASAATPPQPTPTWNGYSQDLNPFTTMATSTSESSSSAYSTGGNTIQQKRTNYFPGSGGRRRSGSSRLKDRLFNR